MDIVALQKQIKSKNTDNFYIFVGENIGLMNIYANKFPNPSRQISFDEVKMTLTTKNIFDTTTKTYIIRDDKECFQDKKNIEILKDFKYNKVILMFTEYDKRSIWYKEFKDRVVEFNQMTAKQLNKVVRDELDVKDDKFIDELVSRCSNDYSQVINTCDQLKHIKGRFIIKLLDSICPPPIDASIFALVKYIIRADKRCMTELQVLQALGEPSLKILASLQTNLETVYKCLKFDSATCESMGIKSWIWKTNRNDCEINVDILGVIVRELNICKDKIVSGILPDEIALQTSMLKIIKLFNN